MMLLPHEMVKYAPDDGAGAAGAAPSGNAGGTGGQKPNPDPKPEPGQAPGGQQKPTPKIPDPEPDGSELGFSDKQQAYVAKLRKEAGSNRVRANELDTQVTNLNKRFDDFQSGLKKLFGGDDSDLTPEQQIGQLTTHNEELELKSAVSEAAISAGITGENFEFFDFLLRKEVEQLEEGQELSEERMTEIVTKAKGQSNGAAGNSTSVNGSEKGDAPPPAGSGGTEVNLQQFVKMTISEKSALWQKNKPLYENLHAQAREGGKLV